jgi:hypothetical protein
VFADPNIKKYTEEVGIHNVVEMSRFLKMLSTQTIQITVWKDGKPITSFIFKTTRDSVEYIDVIHGKIEDSTIDFDFDLEDLNFTNGGSRTKIDNARVILKAILLKKGIRKQLNSIRLFFAGGVELINYLGAKNGKSINGRNK